MLGRIPGRSRSLRAKDQEKPYTTEGFTAPKFGSAGSGGLEHEPAPDQRDRR